MYMYIVQHVHVYTCVLLLLVHILLTLPCAELSTVAQPSEHSTGGISTAASAEDMQVPSPALGEWSHILSGLGEREGRWQFKTRVHWDYSSIHDMRKH